MKVACIQSGFVSCVDLGEKLASVCKSYRPDMVVMPELVLHPFEISQSKQMAEPLSGQRMEFCRQLARERGVWLVPGSVWELDSNSVYNTMVVIDPDGEIRASYRKIHLFAPMGETRYACSGDKPVFVDVDGFGRIGLAICYDIRFPELFRELVKMGCEGFIIVSAFPKPRIDHWSLLARARAVENQAFVLGVNRCSVDRGYEFGGRSLVVDPSGSVVDEAGPEETVVVGQLCADTVRETRSQLPVLKDIRSFKQSSYY